MTRKLKRPSVEYTIVIIFALLFLACLYSNHSVIARGLPPGYVQVCNLDGWKSYADERGIVEVIASHRFRSDVYRDAWRDYNQRKVPYVSPARFNGPWGECQ